MIQKIVGSILVISACSMIGFEKSRELQRHLNELEELKRVFTLLRSEVQYTKAPFMEVFFKISKKTNGIFVEWLTWLAKKLTGREAGTLQEIWRKSIYEQLNRSTLRENELEELCMIGTSLGYLETLDLYLEQLDITIQKTREETTSKKKLYQSMGVMGGIFLVIILL